MNPTPTDEPLELLIECVFDAPRPLVWACWTRQEHADRWMCPDGSTILDNGADMRVGSEWRTAMRAPNGEEHRASGIYCGVVPGERLVFTHAWQEDDGSRGFCKPALGS